MARYVCIVSRDHPILAGYLMVALEPDASMADEIRVVLDRRREPDEAGGGRRGPGGERRRRAGLEAVLGARSFVLVPERSAAASRRERLPVAMLNPDDEGARRAVRWPLTLALGVLGAAAVAGAMALAPPLDLAGLSRAFTTASAPEAPSGATRPAAPAARAAAAPGEPRDPRRATALSTAPGTMPPLPSPAPRDEAPPAALPPRRGAAEREPPAGAGAADAILRAPAFPGLPDVELATRSEGHGARPSILYTARVRDAGGRPVEGAEVSLVALLSDGTRREIRLDPGTRPGTYLGRAPTGDRAPEDLRIRVAVDGRRFEVPVPR